MWSFEELDWDFSPRRPTREWEVSLCTELKASINAQISTAGSDTPNWNLKADGFFSIALVKKAIHLNDPEACPKSANSLYGPCYMTA